MLSIDEVLVMAFPVWRDNQMHMPASLYEAEMQERQKLAAAPI